MNNSVDNKHIRNWQIAGFFTLVVVGSLLHFTYDWSDFSPVVGLFSPVNESVWEHMKLGFYSLLFFSAVEYWFVGRGVNNYVVAKAIGIVAMSLVIVGLFYAYTAFTGDDILIVDVITFIVASAVCQVVVYKVLTAPEWQKLVPVIGGSVLASYAALLIIFTFWTPERALFEDPNGFGYGTEWHVDHRERPHDH